jgi:hypothetical protein
MGSAVLRLATGCLVLLALVASLSCGHDQKLVAITITPNGFTVTDPLPGDTLTTFTAMGEFVYPPESRDISTQVVWSGSFPDIFTIDSRTGVATYQGGCGTNLPVTATASTNLHLPPSGGIITGTAIVNITITGTAGAACP